MLLPTAYTHPEGTVYFSSLEIIVLQAGYAFSDRTQVTLTTMPPLGDQLADDLLIPLDLSLKSAFLREPRVRAAVIGSASGLIGFEEGVVFLGRLGAVTQLCFQDACTSSVTFGGTMVLAGPALLVASGAGGIFPLTSWLTLLLEADFLTPIGRDAGQANGAMVGPGFRFPWESWAIDLSLQFPTKVDATPVIPILWVTYRALP